MTKTSNPTGRSAKAAVTLLGIPFDLHSTFRRGPALAPMRIREVLHAGATNLCSETGVDLAAPMLLDDQGDIAIDTPVYVSIDLDVLDPAHAPGVSHHEPGGLSTRQLIKIIHRLDAPIVGADIVEYNPGRDCSEITAMVAVKLLKEVAARMVEQAKE